MGKAALRLPVRRHDAPARPQARPPLRGRLAGVQRRALRFLLAEVIAIYATLLNDIGVSNQTVLLLDNPGLDLELHLDGQRDIKRFLEEKVALDSQVIYVTHSPAMIDPFNLRQVRTVDLQPNQQGTIVRKFDNTLWVPGSPDRGQQSSSLGINHLLEQRQQSTARPGWSTSGDLSNLGTSTEQSN
jgi:hypothetical protein